MAEYIAKEQVLEWFRPYGYADEPIPFETLVADLRDCIPAADVAPVRHGRWEQGDMYDYGDVCSLCDWDSERAPCTLPYCPDCGARMEPTL